MTQEGIGARLPRKEDARYVRGQGEFVGDIHLPGMQEVTFLRSPVAPLGMTLRVAVQAFDAGRRCG